MAKGVRELMKRKIDQGIDHLTKSQGCLTDLIGIYEGDHEDIIKQLETMYVYLEQGKTTFEAFRHTY